jgi:hypothetical protein
MNAASQLFRALAIIGALAAGALFYLTHGKIEDLTGQLARAKSDVSSASTSSTKDLKDAQDQLASTAAELDKVKKVDLKNALDEADLANKRLDGVKQDLDDSEKASKDKDSKLSDLNSQVADLKPKADSVNDLNGQISALKGQIVELQTQIADLESGKVKPDTGSATSTASSPATPVVPVKLSDPANANVLQVDTKNWVLVLDAGTDSALQQGVQLFLKIGATPVGSAQVLSNDGKLVACTITGTDVLSSKDYANIVKPGLPVSYQRGM